MVLTPSPATLKKYGLSQEEWQAILDRQGGVCAICQKEPTKGRLCIDHLHIKGWKKLPAECRKMWVRGVLCWFCNSYYVGRCITIEKARNVVKYLEDFEARRPK